MSNKQYKLKNLPFNKGYFWSYDFENASLPLSIIATIIIENGNFESLLTLITIFDKNEVFDIYKKIFRENCLNSNWLDEKNIIVFMDIFFESILNKGNE